jgi:hypothetical protein
MERCDERASVDTRGIVTPIPAAANPETGANRPSYFAIVLVLRCSA